MVGILAHLHEHIVELAHCLAIGPGLLGSIAHRLLQQHRGAFVQLEKLAFLCQAAPLLAAEVSALKAIMWAVKSKSMGSHCIMRVA